MPDPLPMLSMRLLSTRPVLHSSDRGSRPALKANRETAQALDAADFVIDNLAAEIDQFDTVIAAMRAQLQSLDPTERARVEDASAVLRKTLAAQGKTLLPLTIVNPTD